MILEKFQGLVNYLVACNGDGLTEITQKVNAGELTPEEAQLVLYYVSISKLNKKLDSVTRKAQTFV
jgi:hypothetical protein